MKHILIITALLLTYNTIFSQEIKIAQINTEEFEYLKRKTSIKPKLNYFKSVFSNNESKIVRALEKEIIDYKLKEQSIFRKHDQATYQVIFKKRQGKAIVNYNSKGDIISSKETFKNIKLPYKLRVKISKHFPGWIYTKNKYEVFYKEGTDVSKCYTIEIKKGNKRKSLKFNTAMDYIK